MKMKHAVILTVLIFLIVLAGCEKDLRKQFFGEWISIVNDLSYVMELDKKGDGNLNIGGVAFIITYKVDADLLTIESDGGLTISVSLYTLSDRGNTLMIKNFLGAGLDVTFTKNSDASTWPFRLLMEGH
jgi:hypothetical protein